MPLRVPEMCLWPSKTRKNFLRCIQVFDMVIKFCADKNEVNWLQLVFYFNVLISIAASVNGMSFFIYVSGCRLKFSRIAVSRKRLQLESKTDFTTIAFFLEFFVGICLDSSTSCLLGLKLGKIAHLLFFFDDIKVFR